MVRIDLAVDEVAGAAAAVAVVDEDEDGDASESTGADEVREW